MELTAWIDMLIVELPALWESLKANRYPESFLMKALGFSQEFCGRLPQILLWAAGFYLLCGVVTLILRFRKGQKSLSSVSHQINTAILVCCSTLFVPLLVYLAKACVYILQNEVAPLQGDYIRYFGEAAASVFYIVMAFAGVAFTVWMPVSSFLRYLKVYRLWGLPHGIFEIGSGMYLTATALISSAYGRRSLYLLLVPAVVMLGVIQRGGYIPEERNIPQPTAAPQKEAQTEKGSETETAT